MSGLSCDNLPVDEVAAGEHATDSDVVVATPEPVTPADAAPSGPGESRFARMIAGWGLPEGVLAVLVVAWSFEFIRLPMLRFDRCGTFGFDLGIYDQGTWLLSRGKDPFVTIRGLELFGHHANIFLLLLVPFYWLGAGPIFLLVVQVLAQASGAIAVFLLARDLLRSKWAGVALAAALLLNPTYQWLTWEFFHPDAVAIGPLLFAYWAARNKRWRWFTVAAVLAVICKEDLALAVAVLGVIVVVPGRPAPGRDRRRRARRPTSSSRPACSSPARTASGPSTTASSATSARARPRSPSTRCATPPRRGISPTQKDRKNWYCNMFAPWAFVPLLDLRVLAVAAATIFVNIVSSFPYTRDYRFHYSAIVVAGCAVATVEAIAWISNRAKQRLATQASMVSVVLVAALVASVTLGCAPVLHGTIKTARGPSRRSDA